MLAPATVTTGVASDAEAAVVDLDGDGDDIEPRNGRKRARRGPAPAAAAVAIDLTLDSDDDVAVTPASAPVGSQATSTKRSVATALAKAASDRARPPVSECPSCARSYCAACGECMTADHADGADDAPIVLDGDSDTIDLCAAPAPVSIEAQVEAHTSRCRLRYVHSVATDMERLRRIYMDSDPTMALIEQVEAYSNTGKLTALGAAFKSSGKPTHSVSQQLHHVARMLSSPTNVGASVDAGVLQDVADMLETMALEEADAAMAAAAAGRPQAASMSYSYGMSASARSGGTGYAGSANDGQMLQAAEAARKLATAVKDRMMRTVLQSMCERFPRQFCAANGYEPVESVLIGMDGSDGVATHAIVLNGVETDGASDHPLLLQMLLLPGFGDGMRAMQLTATEAAAAMTTPSRARRGRAAPRGRRARAPAGGEGPSVKDTTDGSGMLTPDAFRALLSHASASAALKTFGAGDGLRGSSILYRIITEVLRTSVMDMGMKTKQHRELFFSLLQALPALSQHPLAAAFLLFREEDRTAVAAASSSSSSGGEFKPWTGPPTLPALTDDVVSSSAAGCIARVLHDLEKQASVFVRTTTKMRGAAEVLVGDDSDDAEFTAVMCLAKDVQAAADRAAAAVRAFVLRTRALADERDDVEVTDGSKPQRASSGRGAAAAASASSRAAAASNDLSAILAAMPQVVAGRTDPTQELRIGRTKVPFTPTKEAEAAYVSFIKARAFDSLDGLKAVHTFRSAAAAAGTAAGVAASSMKRHMRVSAELAQMPDLATHWASSIILRQDEASMDFLRVMMTGPADTPYTNGAFMFDVYLPQAYPDVNPNVLFLTTGGGMVRFNPNLYAEGKVCLSLLGTWSGPGWIPGTSTLAQVLLSIQGQILVDVPYGNEPGFEAHINTATGRRAVARHNIYLRLGTLRVAMLDQLRSPPKGFEDVVRAHFYFKRDEIRQQAALWLAEAQALALYEASFKTRIAVAQLGSTTAAPAPSPPATAGKKRGRTAASSRVEGPADAAQRLAAEQNAWLSSSAIGSHQPFARGLPPQPARATSSSSTPAMALPGLPIDLATSLRAYGASVPPPAPPGTALTGLQMAMSGMYSAYGATQVTAADVARTMETVVSDLLTELAKLTEPKDV